MFRWATIKPVSVSVSRDRTDTCNGFAYSGTYYWLLKATGRGHFKGCSTATIEMTRSRVPKSPPGASSKIQPTAESSRPAPVDVEMVESLSQAQVNVTPNSSGRKFPLVDPEADGSGRTKSEPMDDDSSPSSPPRGPGTPNHPTPSRTDSERIMRMSEGYDTSHWCGTAKWSHIIRADRPFGLQERTERKIKLVTAAVGLLLLAALLLVGLWAVVGKANHAWALWGQHGRLHPDVVAHSLPVVAAVLFFCTSGSWCRRAAAARRAEKPLFDRAEFLVKKGKLEPAADLYAKAIALERAKDPSEGSPSGNPGSLTDLLLQRANCLADLGKLEAAFATFDEAVQCDPDHWESFFQRGLAKHVFKADHEAALDDIELALQATGRRIPAAGSFDVSEILAAVEEIEHVMLEEEGFGVHDGDSGGEHPVPGGYNMSHEQQEQIESVEAPEEL